MYLLECRAQPLIAHRIKPTVEPRLIHYRHEPAVGQQSEYLPPDVSQGTHGLVVVAAGVPRDGDLEGRVGCGGAIELGVKADGAGAETPHPGFAGHEIAVARVLHRALADLPRERRVAVIVEVHRGARVE